MTPKRWEKELEKIALEFERKVEGGLFLDTNTTLNHFVDKWLIEYAETQLQLKTIESYKSELNNKILPALGNIKLSQLSPVQILSFLNNLLEDGVRLDGRPGGYSDRTIKYQWQILSSVLQTAVYWQLIPENPCRRVKAPKNKKALDHQYTDSKVEFFNEQQCAILLDLIQDKPLKYQLAINIALFCGLRKGEVLGLTWNDIDFENQTLYVNKSRSYLKGKGVVTTKTKTESSNRVLSFSSTLVRLLREYKLWQNGEKAKSGDLWDEEWYNTPWLLTQQNGKGMSYSTLTQWLLKTIRRHNAGVLKDDLIPKEEKVKYILPVLSFHKLRHTSATLLVGGNTDIRTVAARLGHTRTSMTMDIYAHGLKSSDRKASDTLEGLLSVKSADRVNTENA